MNCTHEVLSSVCSTVRGLITCALVLLHDAGRTEQYRSTLSAGFILTAGANAGFQRIRTGFHLLRLHQGNGMSEDVHLSLNARC
jgi:hypothetical protein